MDALLIVTGALFSIVIMLSFARCFFHCGPIGQSPTDDYSGRAE